MECTRKGEDHVFEYRFRKKDGAYVWLLDEVKVDMADNQPVRMYGSMRDITSRKLAETALKESEEKYKTAFETSPDAININQLNGQFVSINKGFTRLTGYQPDEVIGKLSADIGIWAIPEDREKLVSELKAKGYAENPESAFRCKDGSVKTGLMSARLITIGNEKHILSITRDITTRKRLEVLREIQHKIADAVFSSDSLEDLFKIIKDELTAVFDTSSFIIAFYDQKTGLLTAPFEECEEEKLIQWPAEKTLSGIVIRQNRPLLVSREEISKMAETGEIDLYGSRAEIWLGVPDCSERTGLKRIKSSAI